MQVSGEQLGGGTLWVEPPTVSHTSFLIFSLYVWEENTARLSDGLCHIQIINLCFSHLIQSLLTHTYTWFTLLSSSVCLGQTCSRVPALTDVSPLSSVLMHRTHLIYSFILQDKYQRWLQISESLCSARWQWEGRNLHQIQAREKQPRGKRSTKKSRNTNKTKLNSSQMSTFKVIEALRKTSAHLPNVLQISNTSHMHLFYKSRQYISKKWIRLSESKKDMQTFFSSLKQITESWHEHQFATTSINWKNSISHSCIRLFLLLFLFHHGFFILAELPAGAQGMLANVPQHHTKLLRCRESTPVPQTLHSLHDWQ